MATVFNDKIYAQTALQQFVAMTTPLRAFTRDFSAEAKAKGDAVIVPRVDAVTVTTFSYTDNSGFPYEQGGGTITAITVNLDKQFIAPADVTDLQALNSSVAKLESIATQQARALAKQVLQTIFAGITTGSFGTALATATIGGFGRTQIRQLKTGMVKRDVPDDNLSLIVNADVHDALLADTNITQAYAYGGSEAIRQGVVPELLGFKVYKSNILPLNGVSLVGFGAHPDAIAVAMRAVTPQDTGAYLAYEEVTDPESGITLTYKRHFNPGKGRHYANLEVLFGFATGLSLGIGLLARTD